MPENLTFQALFVSIQPSSVGESGHTVVPKVSVSPSGKGEWKEAELDGDIGLSDSFDCRYVRFNLLVASSSKPVSKCPCRSSAASDVLLANVANCDE